jgi:hypothetical protein
MRFTLTVALFVVILVATPAFGSEDYELDTVLAAFRATLLGSPAD